MVARPGRVEAHRPAVLADISQHGVEPRVAIEGAHDVIDRAPLRLASVDGPGIAVDIPRPLPRPANRPMDHATLRAATDAEWRTWMSQPRNLTRTLETLLGRDQGSLRGATNEALVRSLDEVQQRYGIGAPGGPASMRDVVIARQRELVGHGLRERDLDGMVGTRTLEADRRFTRATGQRPGTLPPTLHGHAAMANVDPTWREWVERPDRFARTLEVVLDREPGSLRNATPAELGRALDLAAERYKFGSGATPNLEAAVRGVQERLHAWRSQNGEPVTIDGKVGNDTEAAAAAYRAAHPPEPVRVKPVVGGDPPLQSVDGEPVAANPVVERSDAEPVVTRATADRIVAEDTIAPVVTPSGAPPDQETPPQGPRTFSSDEMRQLSGHLAIATEASLGEITDEAQRWTMEQQLNESRELAGRLVTQWNEAAPDKNAFADTLGRNLTPQEIALLPEGIRERVSDRAILRSVRDVLAPALAGGPRLPSSTLEPEVLTPEGQRGGAMLERFLAETPVADRRRIAAMLTNGVRGGFDLDERWQLPRDVWSRLEAEASYTPATRAGEPPRPIADARAREIAARLAANTDEARADVSQLVTRWYNDRFSEPNGDALADTLAQHLLPAELAQLPGEVRRRIADRELLRTLRANLQADAEPRGMTPPDVSDTSQLAWNRRAAAMGLRQWLANAPSVDRQRIAYILAREITLSEQWLLPRDLWQQVEELARRR